MGGDIVYDEVEKAVNLTADEIDLLTELLSHRLDQCVSIGEEIAVTGLISKIIE